MAPPMAAQPVDAPMGQPTAPPAPPPTYPPATHHAPPTYQRRNPLEMLFSAGVITVMVLIGVILLLVGGIMASQAMKTTAVDYDDAIEESEDAFGQYKTGVTLMVTGNILIVMFLLCGSVMSQNVPTNVKVGFLIFCGILLFCTVWLVTVYPASTMGTAPSLFD